MTDEFDSVTMNSDSELVYRPPRRLNPRATSPSPYASNSWKQPIQSDGGSGGGGLTAASGNSDDRDQGVVLPAMAPRHLLYQPPDTRLCYFYRDGNSNAGAVKVVVNHRLYPTVDVLKEELTRRIEGLPFGVRGIYTPTGRNAIDSVDQLRPDGRYVCSTVAGKARGIDVLRAAVQSRSIWNPGARVSSGQKALNALIRGTNEHAVPYSYRRQAWIPQPPPGSSGADGADAVSDPAMYRSTAATRRTRRVAVAHKKIVVVLNDDTTLRQSLLLYRKTTQSFEQVLSDLSAMFQTPIRSLYTIEGRQIRSLSAIFSGPDIYLAAGNVPLTPDDCNDTVDKLYSSRDIPALQNRQQVPKRKKRPQHRPETKGKWTVWVTTNELPSAGTQAQVSLVVYGHKGCSKPIPLGSANGELFQSGNIDEFTVSVGNIGEVYKIRIAHDNTGEFPGWFCDEVRMQDVDTGEELVFTCQRWLSRDEDDGETCRELPVVRNGIPVLPIVTYEVTVVTGDLWNAGTNANVYITLCGEHGDTGMRQLFRSRNNQKKFQAGQSDVFMIEAVSIGMLSRIVVAHDEPNAGRGWFLDKVFVRDLSERQMRWTFPCRQWLDEEDVGQLSLELRPSDAVTEDLYSSELVTFHLHMSKSSYLILSMDSDLSTFLQFDCEKWKLDSGSEVCLYSENSHKALRILPDSSVDACGQPNDVMAVFTVLQRKGAIRVFRSAANPHLHLAIDNGVLLGVGKGGSFSELIVSVNEHRLVTLESVKFESQFITVLQNGKPGNCSAASMSGLTRQFRIYCKGAMRDKGVIMLCTSIRQTLSTERQNSLCATGKRDRMAQFRVHKISTGVRAFESVLFPNQFIRLTDAACDLAGDGDESCHLIVHNVKERGFITLESSTNRGMYIGMTADGKVRPNVDTSEKNIRLFPEVIEYGISSSQPVRQPSPTPSLLDTKPLPARKKTPPPVEDYADGDWKVQILSIESAENAIVTLYVYGDEETSGPIILGQSGAGLFQAGNVDDFKVNLRSVGEIYKVRIELSGQRPNKEPSWKVKTVRLLNMTTKEVMNFHFDRWLSRRDADKQLMCELPAVRPAKEVLPVITYYVHTYTGTAPGSQTEATVFCNLFGERGDTGPRALLQSTYKVKFQPGQIDVFTIDAVSLGKLQYCIVSHDGQEPGEGWFCEKIVVREGPLATMEYVFPCNRWLDTGADDRKIERMLKPTVVDENARSVSKQPSAVSDTEWIIYVTTGTDQNMSAQGSISICVYGTEGKSELILLGHGADGVLFLPGATDEFAIDVGRRLGQLYKVRFELHNEPSGSGWFLEQVKLGHIASKEVYSARVNRWLSRTDDDFDVCREVALASSGRQPRPVIIYTVDVHTGGKHLYDKNIVIQLQIFGSHGDSGKRILYSSLNNDKQFMPNELDMFELEAVHLGEIDKLVVSIDCPEPGGRWFCEKIIVHEGRDDSVPSLYFPCMDWLDTNVDGRRAKILLRQAPPPPTPVESPKKPESPIKMTPVAERVRESSPAPVSKGRYAVSVVTSANSYSVPDLATAWIEVYGENGKSDRIEIVANKRGMLDARSVHNFEVSLGNLGELYKLRVAREDNLDWTGWHLSHVNLTDMTTNEEFTFKFNRWLSRDMDDHDLTRELPVMDKNNRPVLPVKQYVVYVYTGDRWAASTEAQVFITLMGSKGDSGCRMLYHDINAAQKFIRNQVNTFSLEAVSLENVQKLVIRNDSTGHGAGWFLDKVLVAEKDGGVNNVDKSYLFLCNQWLDEHEDNGTLEMELAITDVIDDVGKFYQPPEVGSKTQGLWKVTLKTADSDDAGTSANVYITVYGGKSNSGKLDLKNGDPKPFQPGKESTFLIDVGDVGGLAKLRLELDNSNSAVAWHLHKLTMLDVITSEEFTIYVDRWLSLDKGDHQLCCELPIPVPKPVAPQIVLKYLVIVHTTRVNDVGERPLIAGLTIYGDHGDTGRRLLTKSATNRVPFGAGQIDVFSLPAVYLGQLKKITVDIDSSSSTGCSWCLEKIAVRESANSLTEYTFRCGRWIESSFSRSETELLCRGEIFGNSLLDVESSLPHPINEPSAGTWTLWLTTADDSRPVNELSIDLIVCGTGGSCVAKTVSQRQQSSSSSFVFKASSTEKFDVDIDDVGRISKLRFILWNSSTQQSAILWHLEKVRMKHSATGQEFNFPCNKWVKIPTESVEKQFVLELAAIYPDAAPLQDKTYRLAVVTGSEPRSETDANVYCIITGDRGDTGKRLLSSSTSGNVLFRRAQEDLIEVSAVDVGNVQSITIGHDGIGRGKGWYCASLRLQVGESDVQQLFPCNRWLDTGCEDRQIQRVLLPVGEVSTTSGVPSNIKSQGAMKVGLKMADVSSMSQSGRAEPQNINNNNGNGIDSDDDDDEYENCDFNSWLQELNFNSNNGNDAPTDDDEPPTPTVCVYGANGMSGPHSLIADSSSLPDAAAELNINVGNIGEIYKVRVCSEQWQNSDTAVWLIGELSIQDVHTGELLKFDYSRFIGETGGDVCKELPALRSNAEVLKVIPYKLSIKTGQQSGEAQSPGSSVFVTIHGQRGDSGARLMRSAQQSSLFQSNGVAHFVIEAVDLGDLQKLTVRKQPGFKWHLDFITVKKGAFAPIEEVFGFDKLIEDVNNEPVSVELFPTERRKSCTVLPIEDVPELPRSEGTWHIRLTTGSGTDVWSAGAVLGLVMCGEKCESKIYPVREDDASPTTSTDLREFTVQISEPIGDVYKIRLGLIGGVPNQKLHVKKMQFEDKTTHDEFTIDVDDWIIESPDNDSWKEYPIEWPGVVPSRVIRYQLETRTGQCENAGTVANVHATVLSKDGASSGKRKLKKSTNNVRKFVQGQSDIFDIEIAEMPAINRVVIGHDALEAGAGWFLDEVVIRRSDNDTAAEEFHFGCNRWLDVGQDDGAIERILYCGEPLSPRSPAVLPITPRKVQEPTAVVPTPRLLPDIDLTGLWYVWIPEVDDRQLSRGSRLVFAIYGSIGKSEDTVLDAVNQPRDISAPVQSSAENMQQYSMKCNMDLGIVYKIRIGIRSESSALVPMNQPIREVRLKNVKAKEECQFKWNEQWTIDNRDWIEYPVWKPNPSGVLPVYWYQVDIFADHLPEKLDGLTMNITINGLRGDTGRHRLSGSRLRRIVSQMSEQLDTFTIQSVDLVEPRQVIVGHNAIEPGAGLYLLKVVITSLALKESPHSDHDKLTVARHSFACNRWLDVGEDDGNVERILEVDKEDKPDIIQPAKNLPANEPKEENDVDPDVWKISILTGSYRPDADSEGTNEREDELNSNNSADERDNKKQKSDKYKLPPRAPTCGILIVLYGDKGKTLPLPLTSSAPVGASTFQPGVPDDFTVRFGEDIGEVYKARIGFTDENDDEQNWLIDTIVLQHPVTGRQYLFELNDRLIRDNESDGWKEVPVKPQSASAGANEQQEFESASPLPVLTYKVDVSTGDLPNAGTSGKIHIMLIGERGDTGFRKLLRPVNATESSNAFQGGQVDIFEIEAVDLQNVTKVVVGHDRKEKGEGWYLSTVVVSVINEDSELSRSWTFHCNRWLDSGEDDGLIERELEPISTLPEGSPDPEVWKVSVTTGVYEPENEPTDAAENETDDGLLEEDGNANNNASANPKYRSVKYKEIPRPPTSQILVVLYGDKGKTSVVPLESSSESGRASFMPGCADDFKVKFSEDIGEVYKLRIGFADDNSDDQNWLLERLVLQNPVSGREYTFELNDRLIRDSELDGWREIPIKVENGSPEFAEGDVSSDGVERNGEITQPVNNALPVLTYQLDVFTGNLPNSGTSATVYVTLIGKRGDTGQRKLLRPLNSLNRSTALQQGQVDMFEIDAVDLLGVTKVIVGHDGKEPGAGWYLSKIAVSVVDASGIACAWTFECNRWFDAGEDDGLIERELEPVAASPEESPAELPDPEVWKVSVTTGVYEPENDAAENETDDGLLEEDGNANNNASANPKYRSVKYKEIPRPPTSQILVVLYGDKGKTSVVPLESSSESGRASFMPGCADDFKVRFSEDIGQAYKIRIGYADDNSEEQNWLLGNMILQNPVSGTQYTFEFNDRLIRDHELDGWREIPIKLESDVTDSALATGSDDVEQQDDIPKRSKESLPVLTYKLDVFTGDLPNSGTNATVYVMLVGSRGDSGPRKLLRPLNTSNRSEAFQTGQVDVFEIEAVDLLGVKKIIAGHDAKEAGDGWHLKKIVVSVAGSDSSNTWTFECNRWFDAGEDDGLIEREVAPLQLQADEPMEETPESGFEWKVTITTGVYEPPAESDPARGRDDAAQEENNDGSENTRNVQAEFDENDGGINYDEDDLTNTNNNAFEIDMSSLKSAKYKVAPQPPTCQIRVVLYGDKGQTPILPLECSSPNGLCSFLPGSADDFKIRFTEDIGEVYKVRVGYADDNEDEQNWLLDTMMLQDPKSNRQFIFELKDRLIRDQESDGWKEIPVKPDGVSQDQSEIDDNNSDSTTKKADKSPLPVLSYKLDVYTGNDPDAGTNATVYMMLVGERGDTGFRKLLKPFNATTKAEALQRGQVDVFEIEAVSVKDVTKLVVGHDCKESGQGWFLQKVVVSVLDETVMIKSWTFDCNRWFDVGKEDGLIERELLQPPPQIMSIWKVIVTTGTYQPVEPTQATDSEIVAEPEAIDSNQQQQLGDLDEPPPAAEPNEAEPDLNDTAAEDATDQDPGADEEVNTNNNADGESDAEEEQGRAGNETGFEAEVANMPSDNPHPPSSQLLIVVYGDLGKTSVLRLLTGHQQPKFLPGSSDEFEVLMAEDVGKIYKLRIGFDDSTNENECWMVEKVILQNPETNKQYHFEFNDRLVRNQEYDGWKEVPLKPEVTPPEISDDSQDNGGVDTSVPAALPVCRYEIEVHTGDLPNAGTDATVYLTLFGGRGDTGQRKLLKPVNLTADAPFSPGQVAVFELHAVHLLTVEKLVVGHDGLKPGEGWFLDRIVIRTVYGDQPQRFLFLCNRWFDVGEDDGRCERQLELCTAPAAWRVLIASNDLDASSAAADTSAANEGEPSMQEGDQNATETVEAPADANDSKNVQEQETDAGQNDVTAVVPDSAENGGHNDGEPNQTEATDQGTDGLEAGAPEDGAGQKMDAGNETGAVEKPCNNLALVLYGDFGKSDETPLSSGTPFKSKLLQHECVREYQVFFTRDIGNLYKMRIGFANDAKGVQQFNLDIAVVEDLYTGSKFGFEYREQIVRNDESDGWRELPLMAVVAPASTDGEQQVVEGQTESQPNDATVTSATDDAAVEETAVSDPTIAKAASQISSDKSSVKVYWLEVHPGSETSGQNDTVFVVNLIGERGDTGRRKLLKPLSPELYFLPAQVRMFEIEAVYLQTVNTIVVGLSDGGIISQGILDKIVLYAPTDHGMEMYNYSYKSELEHDDESTERELSPVIKDGDWLLSVTTGEADVGGLNAQVALTVFDDNSNSLVLPIGRPCIGLFQGGSTDEFCVHIPPESIGEMFKIRIEHNSLLNTTSWLLDKIVLKQLTEPCAVHTFSVQRLLAVSSDDGDVVREVAVVKLDQDPPTVTKYVIQIETGDSEDVEPVSGVHITLYGERGDSGRRYLNKNKEGGIMFEMFKCDTFHIEAIGLGQLQKIVVGYMYGALWPLEKVTIRESEDANEEYLFICNRRSTLDDPETWTEVELPALKQPVSHEADNSDTEATADGAEGPAEDAAE